MTKKQKKQTKKVVKKGEKRSKALMKKLTSEEVRETMRDHSWLSYDPRILFKELGEQFIPELFGAKRVPADGESQKKFTQALMACEFETNIALVMTVPEDYRPMVIELFREIVKEYDCKTPSEKALVEVVVNSYAKTMVYSQKFLSCVEVGKYLSDTRTRYLAVMSKELDRAHRQFDSALMRLKQMKSPSISFNVKTDTAFFADKQQVNVGEQDKQKNENNEAK